MYQSASKPMILPISDIACRGASIPGLSVFTLPPACPFSNTREIHLLACYKAAYRTRRQLMHNRQLLLQCLFHLFYRRLPTLVQVVGEVFERLDCGFGGVLGLQVALQDVDVVIDILLISQLAWSRRDSSITSRAGESVLAPDYRRSLGRCHSIHAGRTPHRRCIHKCISWHPWNQRVNRGRSIHNSVEVPASCPPGLSLHVQ
jgi:hypothetical protein